MHRRTALKLPLYLAAAAALTKWPLVSAEAGRWSADRANAWYAAQGWLLGANYVTSSAVNQIEMFQAGTYDPRRIDGTLWGGNLALVAQWNTVDSFGGGSRGTEGDLPDWGL